MNPGVSEEVGSTARTAISALSSTPAVLAIVIFNVIFMAGTVWAVHEQGARWERLLTQCHEQQQAK